MVDKVGEGVLHTKTDYFRETVQSTPTQVCKAVNRARIFRLFVPATAPTVWVGPDASLTAQRGREVNPIYGIPYTVGPGQDLYAITTGANPSTLMGIEEDNVNEGRFSDTGSGTAKPVSGGGDTTQEWSVPGPPGSGRGAGH